MVINPAQYLKTRRLQSNYMFLVLIPVIPTSWEILSSTVPIPNYISGFDMSFLVRSTSVPGISNEFEIVNTWDNRFTVPKKIKIEHEWTVKVVMTQDHMWHDTLVKWYKTAQFGTNYKTSAYVVLLDQSWFPVKLIQFENVYPMSIPELTELNYETIDGIMELETKFVFDDINYNETKLLNNTLAFMNNPGGLLNAVGLTNIARMGFNI